MSNLLELDGKHPTYKPFKYPEAFVAFDEHEKMHWLYDEVPMADDVKDYAKADKREKEFIENITKLFTQNDIEVGQGYDVLLRIFKPTEVKMMLRTFSARENTHIAAYSHFAETIGFGEEFYSEFLDVPIMKDKIDWLAKAKVKKLEDYAAEWRTGGDDVESLGIFIDRRYKQDIMRMLGVYAVCTEGISLFAQFAMLLKYQTVNKYKGLGTIVEWSIRDEEHHVDRNSWLMRTFMDENAEHLTDDVKRDIYEAVRQIVSKECAMVDYLNPPHMDNEEVKDYIKFIADQRLKLIGFKPNYNITTNPCSFMAELNNGAVLTNFFEGKVTEYTKGSLQGDWEDLRNDNNNS